jgi:hypothetical protein
MGADLSVRACKINLASCYRFGVGVKCNLADAEEIKLKAEMLLPSQESGHLINQVLYQFTEDNVKNLPVP